MYLHIGSETIVSEKNLIGIFDLDNTSVSKFTREFLRGRQQQGSVVTVAEDIPKSFIVCKPPAAGLLSARSEMRKPAARETVYLSQLAASTLRRRADHAGRGVPEER